MTPIVCQTNLAQTILVTRGFYYCARMISEQYGTVFTGEHYEKLQKVYSIWICPDPAKKRRNGIFRYHTVQDPVWGKAYETPDNYDLMEVVIVNLGDADKESDLEILDLAKMMLKDKEPIDKIVKYTGFATDKLEERARSMGCCQLET